MSAPPTFQEIKIAIDAIAQTFEVFKTSNDQKVADLKRQLDELKNGGAPASEVAALRHRLEELEARASSTGRTAKPGEYQTAGPDRPEVWVDRKSRECVQVLSHQHKLADFEPNRTGVSLGRWLRGVLTGRYQDDGREQLAEMEAKALATTPDASGGFTVPTPLAAEFIDKLRAATVLSRAGARTVPMTTKTLSLAKLSADATASWHAENAAVSDSDPTFAGVTLEARTIVALVKLSLELSQDSINVEQMITRSLTGAMAVAVDDAGLGNTIANGPSGILSFAGRNTVTGVGALADFDPFLDALGLLLADNVPLDAVGPIIVGTDVFTDLAKLKDSQNQPLQRPPALTMPLLPTSAINKAGSPLVGTAYMAMWADLLWGLRTDITVRILTEAFFGSNLQLAVLAYMRTDFQPAREESFATIEGIS